MAMKFYNSVGPNPRVVKLFMAEKGISLPEVEVDLRGGENRRPPYNSSVNPAGQTPALELDDGTVLTEITAICEYLEERFPDPALIGTTAEERAVTRMWTRRVDLKICEPLTNGFRFAEGLPLFEPRMRCLPEAAAGLKAVAQDGLKWLDPLIAARRHHALRFPRFRRKRRSAARPRKQEYPALVPGHEGPARRQFELRRKGDG